MAILFSVTAPVIKYSLGTLGCMESRLAQPLSRATGFQFSWCMRRSTQLCMTATWSRHHFSNRPPALGTASRIDSVTFRSLVTHLGYMLLEVRA